MVSDRTESGSAAAPIPAGPFALAAAGIIVLIYWLSLALLHPGYFAPLSPYHEDFYLYTACSSLPTLTLLFGYPRPIAFLGFKLLGLGGVRFLMAAGILIVLADVLLTAELARRFLGLARDRATLLVFAVYCVLVFSHPQFYMEHRHDLPAQISLLFLSIGLLAWMSWCEAPASRHLLPIAALSTVLFAFAKETFFVSAAVVLLGLALIRPASRLRHLAALAVLLLVEVASLGWTNHFNTAFVNVNADPHAPYHMSLAAADLTGTSWFYLSHLAGPALAAIAALGLVAAWRGKRLMPATILLLAGVAALATVAVLPNHKFEEYAWAGVPLFLTPALTIRGNRVWLPVLGILGVLAVAGPGGYRDEYATDSARWWILQDRRGGPIENSLAELKSVPGSARILVAGFRTPGLPWQSENFIRAYFGERLRWSVVLPAEALVAQNNALATFLAPKQVTAGAYDYLASYHPDGRFIGLRRLGPGEALGEEVADLIADTPPVPANLLNRPEFTANPAHIVQPDGSGLGITDLTWNTPEGKPIEIHVDAPNGTLFAAVEKAGHALTGKWVKNRTTFYLQDVTGHKPLTLENTIAVVRLEVE